MSNAADGAQSAPGHCPGTPVHEPGLLKNTQLAQYGFIALPLAFAGLPVYLNAPTFYATSLGVSLTSLGIVLLALRIIDAVQDPFIGSISDHYSGKRAWIIVIGLLLLGGGFWMIFNPVATAPLAWLAASVFICTTGFSVVTINLQALGGIWATTTHDRTRITTWREGYGLIGLLFAAIAPTLLGANAAPEHAFKLLSVFYLPLLAIGGAALLLWLRTAQIARTAAGHSGAGWRDVLSSPWRRQFFAISLLNTFASSIPAVLVLFFIRDRLDAGHLTGLFLLLYFLSGAISMAIWQVLARHLGKVRAWALSMAVAVVTFIWAALLGPGDIVAYAVVCVLSGLALGADLAVPPSILADHIAQTRRQPEASRMFAVMTLISKAAFALATGLALPALGLVGYHPGEPMTPALGISLSIVYAVVPCVLKALTLVWVLAKESELSLDRAQPPLLEKL
ncbi:MFS transporter [Roseibium sp. RKSG952]|uniref:MFS transporter n=1 Tax=Roseibium sp. RKSG952 TaxID=2529384 RepID=UPI0012BBBB2B|nr:MFS transporter [Roseibium sp. RKSG952]MTH98124.1 MFS transporter [Roseibium sp. RKSG952]